MRAGRLTVTAPAISLLIGLTLAQPRISLAQGFQTGNQLLSNCTSSEGTATYYQEQAMCAGYIAGVADALNSLSASVPEAKLACFPSVPLGQARDVVIRYLQENPGKRHYSAGAIAWTALRMAFPCSK
jgi:hypothetical protein